MAILRLKINLSKLDKTAFFEGKTGKMCDLTVFVNDEPDQYGNDASVKQDLGKDRRSESQYVGNGKWAGERPNLGGKQQAAPARRQSTSRPIPEGPDMDPIPF